MVVFVIKVQVVKKWQWYSSTSGCGVGLVVAAFRYIGRNKVSSHLAIPSCGGRGVPGSAVYVAWLAEELIHGNKWRSLRGKGVCNVLKSNMHEYDELSSCRSIRALMVWTFTDDEHLNSLNLSLPPVW